MSTSYENYSVTSQDYDSCRVPYGLEVLLGAFSYGTKRQLTELHILDAGRVPYGLEVILGAFSYGTKRPLTELHILDAGCGTGNYTVALSEYVGKVTGLEVNEGMLGRAMEKTATLKNVSLTQGDVTKMPFSDNQFDAVCCNQVIHHLHKPGTNGYPNIKKFVEEAYRVMKPGGVFVINTCSPDQYQPPVLWYYSLIPNFHKQLCQRTPKISTLQEIYAEVGFTLGPAVVLTSLYSKPEQYYNKEGPFTKEWRNTDSTFSLCSPEELEESLKQWRQKIDDGTADQVIKESDELRQKIGASTSVIGYKKQDGTAANS